MTPKAMAERILEMDKTAAPGPWYAYGKGSGRVEVAPTLPTFYEKENFGFAFYDKTKQYFIKRRDSAEFAAQSRMIAPELARHYLKAVDLLHAVIGNGNYETLGDLNDAIHNFLLEHEREKIGI